MVANVKTGKTLLLAIQNEIKARNFYLAIAKKVKNPLVRRKFISLADDEVEHRQALSRLYWAQTGTEVGDLPEGEDVQTPDVENMSLTEAIELAIEAEKKAVELYTRMAQETDDPRSQWFLEYIAEFENGHYETLTAELERIKNHPGWEDSEVS
ncbi:MAG: ferritin family protein [bacterium]|nr:MAG: ferritin family protein [bacterium]